MSASKKTKFCHGCQAELPIETTRCPYCSERQQTVLEARLANLGRKLSIFNAPATTCLLAVIVVYFVVITVNTFLQPDIGFMTALIAPPGEAIYRWGAHLRGEPVWWRMITANFVHIGLLHIAFNGYALRMVGPYVERTYGAALTLASFVALGSASMLVSNLFGAQGLVAGASGGLMAFIGMAAIAAHREKTQLSLQIRNGMIKWAIATFIFGLVLSWSDSLGVDNIAHFAGFTFGILAGFILPRQSTTGFTRLWMIRLSRFLGILAIAVTAFAFGKLAVSNISLNYQRDCITSLQIRRFQQADESCGRAYRADKSAVITYHNYILVKLITGDTLEASRLCTEGRERFEKTAQNEKLSFDEMCKSIGF